MPPDDGREPAAEGNSLGRPVGVFVGLATLDAVYRVQRPPAPDEKVTALSQELAAGGPAANAAVTFAALGGRAVLVTALGRHPLARVAADDLAEHGVTVVDAASERAGAPAVSSIYVSDSTGERSVVSVNALGSDVAPTEALDEAAAGAAVVLLDGYHPRLAVAAARSARTGGVRVVLDAGSWKPVLDELLPFVDVAACSADFRLPGPPRTEEVMAAALLGRGVGTVVVTHGGAPVRWWERDGGRGAVDVYPVRVVDTLGAGDVFHGALVMAIAAKPQAAVPDWVATASGVAAVRCRHPGPRGWLTDPELSTWRHRLGTTAGIEGEDSP